MITNLVVLFACFLSGVFMLTDREELLLKDPSAWPGHLEPFGSKQPTSKIEEIDYWPEPQTFFKEYVDKSRPVLFKGLAKQSPGYSLFEDDYFKNAPNAHKTIIYAEPEKKENRTKMGYNIPIKQFIERYHNETLYMVHSLPLPYSSQVRIPSPLRCKSTRKMMVSQVTWFSSGGTKSVVHNDDVDNINCLFRGTKDLWMIEYEKNKDYVPIDSEGGYSSLDVDKVNYTTFPQMRKIDMFYRVKMEEGDCLFIPYFWFHQVNSVANSKGMNLAVNVWFDHVVGHTPKGCDIPVSEATIDKYHFKADAEENSDQKVSMDLFSSYIKETGSVSLDAFEKLLMQDLIPNDAEYEVLQNGDIESLIKKLFVLIDVNKDGMWSSEDLTEISSYQDKQYWDLDETVSSLLTDIESYIEKLLEKFYQGTSPESAESSETHEERDEL